VRRSIVRDAAVKHLKKAGIRSAAQVVDSAIKKPATAEEAIQGRGLALTNPDPWPDPVDGAELLNGIASMFTTYLTLPEGAADAQALWVLHTYCFDAFYCSPILGISSPVKRCGKSTNLEICGHLVSRSLPAANITGPALFRAVEAFHPTLLIDEADSFLRENEELRGIMKYQQKGPTSRLTPQVFDVADADFSAETYFPRLEGLDLVEYKRRVESVLRDHFAEHATLLSIRAGKRVRDEELEELARLVLQIDDRANVKYLAGHDPQTRRSLLTVFRGLVGLDAEAVEEAFTGFVHKHPRLSAQQLRFLQVLQNYIAQNGGIEIERLYEPPFTTIHAESVDGIFTNPSDVDDLLAIVNAFESKRQAS
jgi:hypothetical protein